MKPVTEISTERFSLSAPFFYVGVSPVNELLLNIILHGSSLRYATEILLQSLYFARVHFMKNSPKFVCTLLSFRTCLSAIFIKTANRDV
jgi:hypothetical protein